MLPNGEKKLRLEIREINQSTRAVRGREVAGKKCRKFLQNSLLYYCTTIVFKLTLTQFLNPGIYFWIEILLVRFACYY